MANYVECSLRKADAFVGLTKYDIRSTPIAQERAPSDKDFRGSLFLFVADMTLPFCGPNVKQ